MYINEPQFFHFLYAKRPFKPDNIDCNYMTYGCFRSVCPVLGQLFVHSYYYYCNAITLRFDRECVGRDGTAKGVISQFYKIIIGIFCIIILKYSTVISGGKCIFKPSCNIILYYSRPLLVP